MVEENIPVEYLMLGSRKQARVERCAYRVRVSLAIEV